MIGKWRIKNFVWQIKLVLSGTRRYGWRRTASGLLRLLRYKLIRTADGSVTTHSDGICIHFESSAQLSASLLVFEEFVEPEYEFLRQIAKDVSVFVDVGGSLGMYSILIAKLANAQVHVFEPVKENAAMIMRNLEENACLSRVRLNAAAVSRETGFGRIEHPRARSLFYGRLSSITAERTCHLVEVVSLDDYCDDNRVDHIDVLKVDVEGDEPDVIEGTRRLLARKGVSIIILELYPKSEDFYHDLSGSGFEFFYYDFDTKKLCHISQICREELEKSFLTPFHCNIILIHKSALERFQNMIIQQLHPQPAN